LEFLYIQLRWGGCVHPKKYLWMIVKELSSWFFLNYKTEKIPKNKWWGGAIPVFLTRLINT